MTRKTERGGQISLYVVPRLGSYASPLYQLLKSLLRTLGHFLLLSEIKSYVAVLSFYIKMIKWRTLQVSSLKHSIKKDMFFCLGQIEIILVGQGGIPLQPLPPPPLATRLVIKLIELHKKWSFPLRISSVNGTKSAGNCGFGNIYWKNP